MHAGFGWISIRGKCARLVMNALKGATMLG